MRRSLLRPFSWQNLLLALSCLLSAIAMSFLWFHVTNPYAQWNIVKQPYITKVDSHGRITVEKQFDIQAYGDPGAQALGYWGKNLFLIIQNSYFGSYPARSATADGIISDIHQLRFDPSKPYLISGDQFSVLYPRNLGVFYNSLLNPNTAHDQKDWENRQRIYLQSALFALDAFSKTDTLATTVVPMGERSVVVTEAHPGSVPSDTLYGILYALDALQDEARFSNDTYQLQTKATVSDLVSQRRADLQRLLAIYLDQVQDPATGFVREHSHLAAARDGVTRNGSFYDNLVLWKTLSLAQRLGVSDITTDKLASMRQQLLATYWDEAEGHFKDDLTNHPARSNYSSDWLLALPTGFLSPDNPTDRPYLEKSVAFIRQERIAEPFPIKYQATLQAKDVPWAVKTFVPNYGGDAIWSYWGAQYITLLGDLSRTTHNQSYHDEAQKAIRTYREKIVQNHGFPETFDKDGNFLQNSVYKSIRQTGWVVQFETAVETVKRHE